MSERVGDLRQYVPRYKLLEAQAERDAALARAEIAERERDYAEEVVLVDLREEMEVLREEREWVGALNKALNEQNAHVIIERDAARKELWADRAVMLDLRAECDHLRAAMMRHVIDASPGTPDSVKKNLLRALEGSWGEPYESAMLRCPECGVPLELGHDCLAVPCQEPERSGLVDGAAVERTQE